MVDRNGWTLSRSQPYELVQSALAGFEPPGTNLLSTCIPTGGSALPTIVLLWVSSYQKFQKQRTTETASYDIICQPRVVVTLVEPYATGIFVASKEASKDLA